MAKEMGLRKEEGGHLLDEEEDEDDIPLRPKIRYKTSASVNMEEQEAEIHRKKKELKDSGGKAKMVSLMQYIHIDPAAISRAPTRNPTPVIEDDDGEDDGEGAEATAAPGFSPMEAAVEDSILRFVLGEEGSRIRYIFSKASS